MKKVTIYDKATGALLRTYEGPADLVPLQLAEGEAYYDTLLPLVSTKIEAGSPVHFEPPAPTPDHVWDEDRQQHRLGVAGLQKAQALTEIQMLEANQLRALRELALGDDQALGRLAEIDAAIAAKRGKLNAKIE